MKKETKLLIISNNCLSAVNSNGRTLLNLLGSFDKKRVFSLFFNSFGIESNEIQQSIFISNKSAIKSFLSFGILHQKEITQTNEATNQHQSKKSPFKMLIRNIIFNSPFLFSKRDWKKIKEFNPSVILFQCGDLPAHFNLAVRLSKKLNVPLITYSSEDYPLKKHDYIKQTKNLSFFSRILNKKLFHSAKKLYEKSEANVFITDSLLKSHRIFNPKNPIVIYSSSSIKQFKKKEEPIKKVLYAGNLNVGRDQSLFEVTQVLSLINKNISIDVYSPTKTDLKLPDNVMIHEAIPYDELIAKMEEADLLLHVESFDDYWKEDLKQAFSTKIADSLMCGRPFFSYAPNEVASTKYLKEIIPDFVATSKDDLKVKLEKIICGETKYNPDYDLIKRNHDASKASKAFLNIIEKTINK